MPRPSWSVASRLPPPRPPLAGGSAVWHRSRCSPPARHVAHSCVRLVRQGRGESGEVWRWAPRLSFTGRSHSLSCVRVCGSAERLRSMLVRACGTAECRSARRAPDSGLARSVAVVCGLVCMRAPPAAGRALRCARGRAESSEARAPRLRVRRSLQPPLRPLVRKAEPEACCGLCEPRPDHGHESLVDSDFRPACRMQLELRVRPR